MADFEWSRKPDRSVRAYGHLALTRQVLGAAMTLPVDHPLAGPATPPTCAAALAEIRTAAYDVPNIIGGREVPTGHTMPIVTPHAHSVQLGQVHFASAENVGEAITSATDAARWWGRLDWEERSAPFARAADMLEAGPWRDRLVVAAMLELSKTWREADGDAACETIDLIRANIKMLAMYGDQPFSPPGVRNHVEYRPLEGFVFAVSPFNFVSTSNLAFGPALLGNAVVWKPAENASLGAHLAMQLLRESRPARRRGQRRVRPRPRDRPGRPCPSRPGCGPFHRLHSHVPEHLAHRR